MLVILGVNPAASDVRQLESVGVVPVNPKTRASAPLRDRALQVALTDGVSRVARELIVSEGIPVDDGGDSGNGAQRPSGEDPGADGRPAWDGEGPPPAAGNGVTAEELGEILGANPVDYTTHFRILEDRGEQPALFAGQGQFATEYQLVVEVHVDVERVRSELVGAGLLRPELTLPESSGIRMELHGISSYPGYRALRSLLLERLGISAVSPVEFTRERILVELTAEDSDFDLLARLVQEGPPTFEISPLESDGQVMRLVVKWDPAAEGRESTEWPDAYEGDFDDPAWREAQGGKSNGAAPRGNPTTREW
jgi:hypothetical protein